MIGLLIVDDEEVTRRGLATAVDWKSRGVEVVAAVSGGLEALEQLERHHPAVAILDVRMPEMDGIALLQIINERYPATRVILISGYEDFTAAQRAVNLNAFGFLSKPLDEELLVKTVLEARDLAEAPRARHLRTGDLRASLARLSPSLRVSFLCRLASTPGLPEAEARAQALFLGLDLPAEFPAHAVATVVVFDLSPPGRGGEPEEEEARLSSIALADLATDSLSERWRCLAFTHADRGCCLVFHRPEERSDLLRCCARVCASGHTDLGFLVAAGLGESVSALSEIYTSHRTAQLALEYRFMAGRNEAIDYRDVRDHGLANRVTLPTLDELRSTSAEIARHVRAGDIERAHGLLSHLVERTAATTTGGDAGLPPLILGHVLTETELVLGLAPTPASPDGPGGLPEALERARRRLTSLAGRLEDSSRRRDSVLARRALEYMRSHVLGDISLTAVASALRVHPNYLSTVIRADSGRTFIDHEITLKMDMARKLVAEGHHRVYEVAALLHYRDLHHFTRLFKKHVGVSPSEYRQAQ